MDMRYVNKTQTWDDDWNDVIRTVFFKDEILRELMLVPENTPIVPFITKYFLKDAAPDALLTTEKVRVSYYDTEGYETVNQNVKLRYKAFDIYVKESELYNATHDRIKSRAVLIAERIKYLMLRNQYIGRLRFSFKDEYDLWTKTIGYQRYHIVLHIKQLYERILMF